MKRIFIFLSLIISFYWSFGQTTDAPRSIGPTLGVLYGKATWANASDFTSFGGFGMTITAVSNKLNISTTNPGVFNSTCDLTAYGYSLLENSGFFMRFTIDSARAAYTKGPVLSFHSQNSHALISYYLYCDLSLGGTGRLYLATNYPSQQILDSSYFPIEYTTGDSIEYNIQRQFGNVFVATARNATTNATSLPVQLTYVYPSAFTTVVGVPNTSLFSIGDLGGLYTIDSLQIYSNVKTRPLWAILADSKYFGYGSDFTNRVANLLTQNVPDLWVSSGQGDRTSEVQERLHEIYKVSPINVIIGTGANDPDSNTTKTNITNLVDSLQAHGINCYFSIFFQNNNAWEQNWLVLTYGANHVFPTWQATAQTDALNSDGVHLTGYGDTLAYYALLSSGLFPLASYPNKIQLRSTEQVRGYMSAVDKMKLDSLYNYNSVTSFLQPQTTGNIAVQDQWTGGNTSDINGRTPPQINTPGGTWTRLGSPTAGIESGSLYAPVAANAQYYISTGGLTNQDVSIVINNVSNPTGGITNLIGLETSGNTLLQMVVVGTTGFTSGTIIQLIGGVATQIYVGSATPHVGDTFHLKTFNGTAYAYQGQNLLGSAPYNYNVLTGTGAGFGIYQDTSTKFGTFQVSDYTNYPNFYAWQINHDGTISGNGTRGSPLSVVGGGSGITQLTGPVTAGPGSGSQASSITAGAVGTTQLAANGVTLAKMATNTANTLLGYDGSGNPVDITAGSNITISGGTISSSGGGSAALTSTYVGYGNASNILTGTSEFTYNHSTQQMNVPFGVIGTGNVATNNLFAIRTPDTLHTYELIHFPTKRGDTATTTKGGNFGFYLGTNGWVAADGVSNNVFGWGYNWNGAGGLTNSNEAAFFDQLQTDATTSLFKRDIGFITTGTTVTNVLEMQVPKGTNTGAQVIGHADVWDWYNEANTSNGATFNAGTGVFQITGTAPSFTLNPNGGGFGQLTIGTNSSGQVVFSNSVNTGAASITWSNPFTINPGTSTTPITIDLQAGTTVGINFSGAGTGGFVPLNINGGYTGGVINEIINTSGGSVAYSAELLQTAGTGGVNNSPMIIFRNNGASGSKDWTIGNNTNTGNLDIAHATAGLLGSGQVIAVSNAGNLLLATQTDVASSLLTMNSTTKGFLLPRMTTTQQNAISSPATGLMIYDNVLNNPAYYNGSAWVDISGGGVTTVGSFSGSGITNGASISGSTITFGPADATHPGMVSTGTQTLAGNKLFTGNIDIGGSSVPANSLFTIEGNSSYFPSGNSGARLNSATGTTNTDAVTTGTSAANMWIYSLNAPTLAATNTGVTYPIAATLFVNIAPSAGTNVTLTNAYSIYANGNSFINGNLSSPTNSVATFSHFVGNSSTPTIAAGTGAGTGPTVSITGTDQDGVISVTAGTTPGTSATVATITFSLAFPTNTFPVLTPANSNAALLSGVTMVYTTGTTTNFTITSGTSALTSTLQYKWYYHVGAD